MGPRNKPFRTGVRRMYLMIVAIGIILIGIVGYNMYSGDRINTVDAALLRAVMKIRLEASTTNLVIEGLLGEGLVTNFEPVWVPLDAAVEEYRIIVDRSLQRKAVLPYRFAVPDAADLKNLEHKLSQFKTKAAERFDNQRISFLDAEPDRMYRRAFNELIWNLESLEERLRRMMSVNLARFRYSHVVMIVLCLLLTVLTAFAFQRFTSQRTKAYRALQDSNRRLESEIGERLLVEEELRNIRDKLKARVKKRTAQLEKRADQLSRLTSELTLAEQRERRRIAEILHDHLQQLMVGAKIGQEVLVRAVDNKLKPAAENVLGLINQLIKASRSLTAEIAPPILRYGDLTASLEWLVRWLKENQGFDVDLQSEPGIVLNRKDLTVLLFQSIRELLLNILKHAGVKAAAVILKRQNGNLRIIVSDQGVGFDQGMVSKNADSDQKFGLISIRERLMHLGGRFEFESRSGAGSTFTLTVPLDDSGSETEDILDTAEKDHRAQVSLPTGKNKIRVMIVDDHSVMRHGLSTMLGLQPGIEVVAEASDGIRAVDLARKFIPDVILMDINLPQMNGLDATRIIHSELPQIRIIGLSMYDQEEQGAAMKSAGASAYRCKSDNINLLLAAIRGEAV